MTFANPAVVTINAVAKNLPKIKWDDYEGGYKLQDSTTRLDLKIRHSTLGTSPTRLRARDRHNVELTQTVFATGGNPERVTRAYIVFEHDQDDVSSSVVNLLKGFVDFVDGASVADDLVAWLS